MSAPEHAWQRRYSRLTLSVGDVMQLLGEAVLEAAPLSGGLRNTNYRVQLAGQSEASVLRVYTADRDACAREAAILTLVQPDVPVPRVLRSEPAADPPWSLLTWIDAERFDVAQEREGADVHAMAYSAGGVLARIHAFEFNRAGFFDATLRVQPFGQEFGWPRWLETRLTRTHMRQQLGVDLALRLGRFVQDNAWRLESRRDAPCLSHSDYKPWNLLVRDDAVVGVLDWEFAFAGQRLNDIANFVRHSASQPVEYEAGFIDGYLAAGGTLPDDWKRLARLTDLMALLDMLDRTERDTAVAHTIVPLIEATLREFA